MSGKVVVIGGSKRYHGAPVLAAHAVNNTLIAMKIGAGFARLYVPETILNAARSLSPNIIVSRLGNTHLEEGDVAFVKLHFIYAQIPAIVYQAYKPEAV